MYVPGLHAQPDRLGPTKKQNRVKKKASPHTQVFREVSMRTHNDSVLSIIAIKYLFNECKIKINYSGVACVWFRPEFRKEVRQASKCKMTVLFREIPGMITILVEEVALLEPTTWTSVSTPATLIVVVTLLELNDMAGVDM
jgi:hypothetical protein